MGQKRRKLMNAPDCRGQPAGAEKPGRLPCMKPGVLVVDDDHLVRIMVQLGLERDGYEVWLASDGRTAIDLYKEHREDIAVVLLEFGMPGLDGPRTLEALRQINPGVQACFLNDATKNSDPEELRQYNVDEVIAKPFHLEELAKTLWLLRARLAPNLLASIGVGQGCPQEDRTQ